MEHSKHPTAGLLGRGIQENDLALAVGGMVRALREPEKLKAARKIRPAKRKKTIAVSPKEKGPGRRKPGKRRVRQGAK